MGQSKPSKSMTESDLKNIECNYSYFWTTFKDKFLTKAIVNVVKPDSEQWTQIDKENM
jgi:hypothetical protein